MSGWQGAAASGPDLRRIGQFGPGLEKSGGNRLRPWGHSPYGCSVGTRWTCSEPVVGVEQEGDQIGIDHDLAGVFEVDGDT